MNCTPSWQDGASLSDEASSSPSPHDYFPGPHMGILPVQPILHPHHQPHPYCTPNLTTSGLCRHGTLPKAWTVVIFFLQCFEPLWTEAVVYNVSFKYPFCHSSWLTDSNASFNHEQLTLAYSTPTILEEISFPSKKSLVT